MGKLIKKETKSLIPKPLGLKEFYKKRNKVLLWHDKGGLGDALMQRMLFQDFKNLCPNIEITFACLPEYINAIKDHEDLYDVLDSRNVNLNEFILHYNTCVSIADKYENFHAPCQEHRSDIWAKYCGMALKTHDMKFNLDKEKTQKYRNKLKELSKNEGPIVLFSPVSKMSVKTLLPDQIEAVQNATKHANLITIHNQKIQNLDGIYDASLEDWMYYISASDYVISVDSAAFHMAGGLRKPLMGIFTFADGKAYGKYFDFILVQKHRDNGNWDCGPCFKFADCFKCKTNLKPCLTELSSEEIANGVKAMFDKWKII